MPAIVALEEADKDSAMFDSGLQATTLDEVRPACAAAPAAPAKRSKRRKP